MLHLLLPHLFLHALLPLLERGCELTLSKHPLVWGQVPTVQLSLQPLQLLLHVVCTCCSFLPRLCCLVSTCCSCLSSFLGCLQLLLGGSQRPLSCLFLLLQLAVLLQHAVLGGGPALLLG